MIDEAEDLLAILDLRIERYAQATAEPHPWIPGANFADGEIDQAIEALRLAVNRARNAPQNAPGCTPAPSPRPAGGPNHQDPWEVVGQEGGHLWIRADSGTKYCVACTTQYAHYLQTPELCRAQPT